METINAMTIINENVPPIFEKYSFYTRMSKNEYVVINAETSERFLLKTGNGVSIKSSRRDVARHIAQYSNFTIDQAEEFIEMEGCAEINKRYNLPYKYAYLLCDVWLICKVK